MFDCMISAICGYAFVIDGDTLLMNREKVRIAGIDAPEMGTVAGENARMALTIALHGKKIKCFILGRDKYYRLLANCVTPAGNDVGSMMVEHGYARVWR
jgi:endonuclease YncB( thermonuclease family)